MSQDPSGARPTLLYHTYRLVSGLLLPFAFRKVANKLAAHGVEEIRQRERLGHATAQRPEQQAKAPMIWFHGASVGESQAALTLISQLSLRLPQARFLLTSGTATSAALAAKRLPECCQHQFAPLDAPAAVDRFLKHWRPDAGIFVDSELWPVTLATAAKHGVKLALVNARLSERSLARWRSRLPTARFVFSRFSLILTQNDSVAEDLLSLGVDPQRLQAGGNLKAAAPPLPADENLIHRSQALLQGRPIWVASSTHLGEEETILDAHAQLRQRHPHLCLILVPRHPERGHDVEQLITARGLTCARRSKGEEPNPETSVYLADTLGELGSWYRLSPIVFLGGSLKPIGGHNPFEVATAGATVLTGPETFNFAESFPPMIAAGGAKQVTNTQELAQAVDGWLIQPDELDKAKNAARLFATEQAAKLEHLMELLIQGLNLEAKSD